MSDRGQDRRQPPSPVDASAAGNPTTAEEDDDGGLLSLFYNDGDEPSQSDEEGAATDQEEVDELLEAGAPPPSRGPFGWLRIREDVPTWMHWLLGLTPILALLALWWGVTAGPTVESRMISSVILPSPLEVARSFPSLWFDRAVVRHLGISFGRVLAGFAVGLAIAFPLGLLMGAFSKIKAMFNPLAVFGAYLPIPALVPLSLSLFGTDEKQKVAFLAMAFSIYMLPLIVAAVEGVDEIYLKTAYTLGASKLQAVLKVLLAVSWQDVFQAMRLGFGIGWSYIILVEMVDIGKGVGGMILISQRRGELRPHIYLIILLIVTVAFLTDKLWQMLGHKLFPYREAHR